MTGLQIKQISKELGFHACGIARAEKLIAESDYLHSWIDKGFHADMQFMQRDIEKRINPTRVLNNAKSIIMVLQAYPKQNLQIDPKAPMVARYAQTNDYHITIKDKLVKLVELLKPDYPTLNYFVFSDSSPVMDIAWAHCAGLGWVGKNTLLIHPELGSYFNIGGIIVDVDLEYDIPIPDACGACMKCVSACPTKAILSAYKLDARSCISYHTVESKGDIPHEISNKMGQRFFGCDSCQEVCPYNKEIPELNYDHLNEAMLSLTCTEWLTMTETDFKNKFMNSPIARLKYLRFKRNLKHIAGC